MKRTGFFIAGILAGAVLAGCGREASKDPRMILAEKCRESGDFAAAERQIRSYLASHPDSEEAHLRMAALCDEGLADPVGAVFHYREVLRLNPNFSQAEEIRAWMTAAQKKCAPPPDGPDPALAAEQLRRENLLLRRNLAEQQQEILEMRRKTASVTLTVKNPSLGVSTANTAENATVKVTKKDSNPSPAVSSEYVVRRGDSLGKIARRFYGSASKIRPIMAANNLTENSVLRIGQKLIIPKTEEVR